MFDIGGSENFLDNSMTILLNSFLRLIAVPQLFFDVIIFFANVILRKIYNLPGLERGESKATKLYYSSKTLPRKAFVLPR